MNTTQVLGSIVYYFSIFVGFAFPIAMVLVELSNNKRK